MIILAIVVLVVVPPEKLPEVMRTVGSLFNDIRRQTSGIWDDLKKDAAFRPDQILSNEILKPADFTIQNILDEKKSSVPEEKITEKNDVDTKQS